MSHDLLNPSLAVPRPRSTSLFQGPVLGAFAAMKLGRMRLQLPDGTAHGFGTAPDGPVAHIVVRRPAFFTRCALYGDVGFAEAYVDGDWETPDLTALLGWFVLNLDSAPTLTGSRRAQALLFNLLRGVNRAGHLLRPNSRTNARRNIGAHYDLSNDFFALWLDPTMMYSGASWAGATTLEEAQTAKNDALCRKLRLQPADHILEIGTGWGGWSLHAAGRYGCRVTTVTISRQQYDFARARVAAAGLAGRVEVRLEDYRDLTGTFDKIVSIEMLEAVGHRYLPEFAALCGRRLKRDGLLALQFITYPDSRYDQLRRGVDFIQKHIFPGSLLLSLNRVNDLLSRQGDFVLHGMEDLGLDYARTLQAWRRQFHAAIDQVKGLGFDDRFIRKWDYYLAYCETGFAHRNISVVQTVHTRPNNLSL